MSAGSVVRRAVELLLLGTVLGLLFLRAEVYRPVQVVQQSMEPTLHPGDRLLVNTWKVQRRLPKRGTVVVLQSHEEGVWLVKRVVAVAGDKVATGRWGLWLNGRWVKEPYAVPYGAETTPVVTVPADSVYVLGDNRPESNDSRDFGPVFGDEIVGEAVAVMGPKERRRWLEPAKQQ